MGQHIIISHATAIPHHYQWEMDVRNFLHMIAIVVLRPGLKSVNNAVKVHLGEV
jgi:hypothetical protein